MADNSSVTDRRLAENALLRQLVDALKLFIAARDAIWSLNAFDRFFNTTKYKQAYAEYDECSAAVNGLIRAMAIRNSSLDSSEPVLSTEEFDALMRLSVGDHDDGRRQHDYSRKRKADTAAKTVGPAFSPIVPPASSIAPTTPSGANAIRDQELRAFAPEKNGNA